MCGIAGIYERKYNVSLDILKIMADCLSHRGPDSTGFFISKKMNVGLAHKRLSIIDLTETANQPMSNEDGSIWLVFNGEIYNYKVLRDILIEKGHIFRSKSDSEVILHLYEDKGEDLASDLKGMFAFCILDENKNIMLLMRDRIGIKPLYFCFKESFFAFASELKSLIRLPQLSDELDLIGLDYYFTLGYIPRNLSIFKDIRKLQPGHLLAFDGMSLRILNYWKIRPENKCFNNYSEKDLVGILEQKLRESVKSHMVSDVPIGSFLSGGLDSSLISMMMAHESPLPINTFTITFGDLKYNEAPYANIIAKEINSSHKEYRIEINAVDALEKLIFYFDEPFADSSLIPTYYISKVAKEIVTVILSGDGGDELFGGYNWYSWALLLNKVKRKLGGFSKALSRIASIMPESFYGSRFLSMIELEDVLQYLERICIFSDEEKKKLFKNELKKISDEKIAKNEMAGFFKSIKGDLVDKMTVFDLNYYLPDDILTKVDRASMAVSLETRVPWLDHELVEFAFSLPSSMKINGDMRKYLPKKLAQKLLPKDFPLERKQGFCIPMNKWIGGKLARVLREELSSCKCLSEIININYIKELLNRCISNPRNNLGPKIFAVLVFAIWLRNHIYKK